MSTSYGSSWFTFALNMYLLARDLLLHQLLTWPALSPVCDMEQPQVLHRCCHFCPFNSLYWLMWVVKPTCSYNQSTWCIHLMCSSDVFIWCVHLMCSSDVFIWCVHLASSPDLFTIWNRPVTFRQSLVRQTGISSWAFLPHCKSSISFFFPKKNYYTSQS